MVSALEISSEVYDDYEQHSNATRTSTELVLKNAIRKHHPDTILTIVSTCSCDLLGFAVAGEAQAELDSDKGSFIGRSYKPPRNRIDEAPGKLNDDVVFACYTYRWKDLEFLVFVAECSKEATTNYSQSFILRKPNANETIHSKSAAADDLVFAVSQWTLELHEEIWIFDQGFWQKSQELYRSMEAASWDDVILDEDTKTVLIDDVEGFFDSKDLYKQFGIQWKRGVIFHGSPGNGKTISIRAIMRSLAHRQKPVPSLYVKSFVARGGPERAIRQIFQRARTTAPCLLIFEDLDSLVTDQVRSYFLNELDGLESNDGILIVGSTNHLERLDPGISKRPSRFDRKYLFDLPSLAERVQYCEYWRSKLRSNTSIEFPERLSTAIAELTDKFSFAYMKEAFVASLVKLIRPQSHPQYSIDSEAKGKDSPPMWKGIQKKLSSRTTQSQMPDIETKEDEDLNGLPLWVEMKRNVKGLREELEGETKSVQASGGKEKEKEKEKSR